jgi:hypothetical protein
MLESKLFINFSNNHFYEEYDQCNSVDVHQHFEQMYRLAANCNKKTARGARGFYRTTRRHNAEDRICHRCENLNSNNSFHVREITREDRPCAVAQTVTLSSGMFRAMLSCSLGMNALVHELSQRFRIKYGPLFYESHCSPTERTLWLSGWHSKSP